MAALLCSSSNTITTKPYPPTTTFTNVNQHNNNMKKKKKDSFILFAAKNSSGFSLNSILKKCERCGGQGAIECPECKGTGKNKKNGNIFERWKYLLLIFLYFSIKYVSLKRRKELYLVFSFFYTDALTAKVLD
ncbi:hypothetical protein M9H77_17875 [Catharanthus roseus]|uniref:Uncharacterized protein n=1 Tax=Catharanthus roseus TaxID=4058 RepID=A0ACC0B5W3_CATRO|nr:hypothetical protein M9H77_17875 [Catharanthus roseus]